MKFADGAGRTPPGPSRLSSPVLLTRLATDRLGMLSGAVSRWGDAVRLPVGHRTLYFFNHPEHAKHVLVDNNANYTKGIGYIEARRALGDGLLTSDGPRWHRQRRAAQPSLRAATTADRTGAIEEHAAALVDRLAAKAGSGPVDMLGELTVFTLGVLGDVLLDVDLSRFGRVAELFDVVQDQAMFEMQTLGLVPTWLPSRRQRRFQRAQRDLTEVVDELLAEHLTAPRRPGPDLLAELGANPDGRSSTADIRDELITLLLAGHETTASTVGWALYLLADEPSVRQRLRDEAIAVCGERRPSAQDLPDLTYTRMVLHEVMRLRPPVWILTRRATHADTIGGYHVPAGADVLICPYTLHRRPDSWPDPETFDPLRFASTADRPRHAYLPFGAGPRACVGSQLGMLEASLVLASVSRDLDLTLAGRSAVEAEPMLSLRLRGGLPMTVARRSPQPPEAAEPVASGGRL